MRLCRGMQNSDPEGWNFLSTSNTHVWVFFLHTFRFLMIYFKSSIYNHMQWCWHGTFFKITSLWHRNDINLMTQLRDVLYNLCKPNHVAIFFMGWDNMGEIRFSIPSENLGFPYARKWYIRTKRKIMPGLEASLCTMFCHWPAFQGCDLYRKKC